ncbi:MAG: LysM peptidoglycan-binding domain-containing protein [Vicingus serpentipes]|nr:LysM peptidoglycan-binding domain-containing protein [Vicingus serpentipes]
MQKITTHTLKILGCTIFFIPTIATTVYSQKDYPFTPPKTVYTNAFYNSNKSVFNQSIVKYIELSQPIYLTGSKINTNPVYINNRLKKYDNSYLFTLNYYVQQYITTYTEYPSKIAYSTNLLNHYSTIINDAINSHKLPKSFQFIPLVCSGFNPLSVNQRGGYGYWHLNYAPAVKYGLTINEWVDERKDFKKSTLAATSYLEYLYALYHDWELTLAAYSCGITTVNKALKRTESQTFWEIYPYLPESTRDFVPALTAMAYCYYEARNDNYLLEKVELNRDTILIERKLHFFSLKQVLLIDTSILALLNPSINQQIFPKGFNAIFPGNSKSKFLTLKDNIYYYQDSVLLKPKTKTPSVVIPKEGEPFTYKVKSGDVLGLIAERFNVRVSQIQEWNNLNGTRINIGQELTIYGKSTPPTNKNKPEENNPLSSTTKQTQTVSNDDFYIYTVKSGDNLWLIAKDFPDTSAEDIMELNDIDENLQIGQVLKIKKK